MTCVTFYSYGVVKIKLRCDYYHKTYKGNYKVGRYENNVWIPYCKVSTEKQAIEVVKFLKENNWNMDSLSEDHFDFNFVNESSEPVGKYYTKSNDTYRVQKNIDGTTKSFGHYDTEEEAQKVVEYLKMIDWDEELFEKYKKDLLNGKIL